MPDNILYAHQHVLQAKCQDESTQLQIIFGLNSGLVLFSVIIYIASFLVHCCSLIGGVSWCCHCRCSLCIWSVWVDRILDQV